MTNPVSRVNRDTVVTVSVATIAMCAIVLTLANVRRAFFPPHWSLTQPTDTVVAWPSFAGVGHRVGPSRARVTVVVFSDYQCPACRRLDDRLTVAHARYPNEVAVVWRHMPLEGHSAARSAALAAVCAANVGQFALMHSLLFMLADSLGTREWTNLAARAGVGDTTAFRTCMASPAAAATLDSDLAAARELGALATPTFLINSQKFVGVPGDLDRIVRSELNSQRR